MRYGIARFIGAIAITSGFYIAGAYGARGDRLHDFLWFWVGMAGLAAYGYACSSQAQEWMRKETVKMFAGTAGTAKTRLFNALIAYEKEHGPITYEEAEALGSASLVLARHCRHEAEGKRPPTFVGLPEGGPYDVHNDQPTGYVPGSVPPERQPPPLHPVRPTFYKK